MFNYQIFSIFIKTNSTVVSLTMFTQILKKFDRKVSAVLSGNSCKNKIYTYTYMGK